MSHEKLARLGLVAVFLFTFASPLSAKWEERVIYSFQGGNDGAIPAGGVVFDKAGNLYGATSQGGGSNCPPISNCGTVFQLSPPVKKGDLWTETVLHVFSGVPGNDGATPAGSVVIDANGNLYGTTAYGGSGGCVLVGIKGGCGTVYELSPPQSKGSAWTYTILYSFQRGKDGYFPWGDLTLDSKGNSYGATQFGGGKGTSCNPFYQYCGTVFELSPPKQKGGKWTEKVLHSFAGIAVGKKSGDGANPNGGLTFDGSGNLYGSSFVGGLVGIYCPNGNGYVGCGAIFKLKHPNTQGGPWSEEILHRLKGHPTDGSGPNGSLIFDTKGSLYGTAAGGGSADGVAFKLTQSQQTGHWGKRVLCEFGGGNGATTPMAGLTFTNSGGLVGTTSGGGAPGGGTVFRLTPHGSDWMLNVLHAFAGAPDGSYPASKLTFDQAGHLYGTTQQSGNTRGDCGNDGCGTVFEIAP